MQKGRVRDVGRRGGVQVSPVSHLVYWKRRTKNRGMELTHSRRISHQTSHPRSRFSSVSARPRRVCTQRLSQTQKAWWGHEKTRPHAQRVFSLKKKKDENWRETARSGCGHWSKAWSWKYDTLWEEADCECVFLCVGVCVCLFVRRDFVAH